MIQAFLGNPNKIVRISIALIIAKTYYNKRFQSYLVSPFYSDDAYCTWDVKRWIRTIFIVPNKMIMAMPTARAIRSYLLGGSILTIILFFTYYLPCYNH